ncbi:MAG: hypothetical protein COA47_04445 [Robiginitomaculum sp.]|nr:MAG: hypothetical protein COA47_04445 [Robiginitomaculum sp.]
MSLVQKTLLVCFGPLGRLLNSFCAAARLREASPDGHLVLLTSPALVGLAAKSPWFDNIISADLSASDINLSHLAKAIKQNKFDRIIDLERSDATATMFAAFGLFPPKFAGHAPRAKWRLPPQAAHPIDADNQLLDLVGIAPSAADLSQGPKLDWLLRQIGKTPSLEPAYFGLEGSYVLLNLGNPNPEQVWPALAFQTLAGNILDSGHMLAITGGIDTRDLARPLIRKYPQIRDLCARADPFQLAALGAKAKGVVGMADGMLHLCAAGSARCISLHGSKASANIQAIRTPNAVTLIAEPLEELSAADVLKAMKMFGAL